MLIPCQVPRAVFAILWGDGKDARYGGEKFPEPELKALTEWLSTSPEQLKPHHLAVVLAPKAPPQLGQVSKQTPAQPLPAQLKAGSLSP